MSSLKGWVRFSRERVCTALDAGQALVDVHRMQQGLVEARLVLLGDEQHLVFPVAKCSGSSFSRTPSFIFSSVQARSGSRSSRTTPEKATSDLIA